MANKIQFEELRTGADALDAKFVALRQELNQAFFGSVVDNQRKADGWRAGMSKPFLSWDVQPTVAESRKLHGFLTAAIGHIYRLMLRRINEDEGSPVDFTQVMEPSDGGPAQLVDNGVASAQWLAQQKFMPANELRTNLVGAIEGRFPGKTVAF